MVLGTPTTFTPCSCSRAATPRVSSPPIATSASMPRSARLPWIRSSPERPPLAADSPSGLVRDVPRIVPPRGRMPRTAWTSRGTVSPSSGPRQPSRNPTNSYPYSCTPLRTTARMTAFRPGQSPPPVRTPTLMGPTLVRGDLARMPWPQAGGRGMTGARTSLFLLRLDLPVRHLRHVRRLGLVRFGPGQRLAGGQPLLGRLGVDVHVLLTRQ